MSHMLAGGTTLKLMICTEIYISTYKTGVIYNLSIILLIFFSHYFHSHVFLVLDISANGVTEQYIKLQTII